MRYPDIRISSFSDIRKSGFPDIRFASRTRLGFKWRDPATRTLQVFNRTGRFSSGETITGQTSGATALTETYNTINNVNSEFDQNFEIETVADGIVDFTEGNPFGEFGNKGSTI